MSTINVIKGLRMFVTNVVMMALTWTSEFNDAIQMANLSLKMDWTWMRG